MTLEKTVSKTWNEFEDFNVGDVVKLKSGGPNMTIDNASGTRIICAWFDSLQMYHTQTFDQGALEKVDRTGGTDWIGTGDHVALEKVAEKPEAS